MVAEITPVAKVGSGETCSSVREVSLVTQAKQPCLSRPPLSGCDLQFLPPCEMLIPVDKVCAAFLECSTVQARVLARLWWCGHANGPWQRHGLEVAIDALSIAPGRLNRNSGNFLLRIELGA